MPPKKRQKTAIKPRNRKCAVTASAKSSAKAVKGAKNSCQSKPARAQTRSKSKIPSSKTVEAAKGAGIRSTAELQEYMRQARNSDSDTELQLNASEQEIQDLAGTGGAEPVAQTSNNATPTDEVTSSSDSESDHSGSESGTDSDGSSETPVKRKLPFDRRTKEFGRVDISPASLENGRDTRDLNKLQELLLANPQAVDAIDSMLQLLKSTPKDNSDPAKEKTTSGDDRPGTSNRVPFRGPVQGNSETTIYTRAVPSASPSQQDQLGQAVPMDRLALSLNAIAMNNTEGDMVLTQPQADANVSNSLSLSNVVSDNDPPRLREPNSDDANRVHQERVAAKTRTDAMIVEAERQKLALEKPLAGTDITELVSHHLLLDNPGSCNLDCDDKLFALAVHLDKGTIGKIENGDFVELSKLLPRDKVLPEDEFDKVEIVSKDGKPAFNPIVDKDSSIINCFKKWEAAFDVYAGVFVRAHPKRGPEIFEYKHTIRKASESFVWSGIYAYDKIFRTHMETNKGRTWGKKLKDVWTDHVHMHLHKPLNVPGEGSGRKRKICRFFNKNGKCVKGSQCEYEHRCAVCFMFGHGKYNCRRAAKKDMKDGAVAPTSHKNQSQQPTKLDD